MAVYRNHRRFTFRCIMAGITPISCKLKNPLKYSKSYKIIHKAEKQLLYERIRNVNTILYMSEHNRYKYYLCLRNMIRENEVNSCLQLINRIKEHRYAKLKAKQIGKFEHLVPKSEKNGHHHNFTRGDHSASFNISQNSSLSRQLLKH